MSLINKQTLAPAPRTARGLPSSLSAHPSKDEFCYCSGTSVIIRNLKTPELSEIVTCHQHATQIARYSPNGSYIASGDAGGVLRLWDTHNSEHIAKLEQTVLGSVFDVAWSMDNSRVAVVGEGKERLGVALSADSGTTIGELRGHGSRILSCDFKPSRPFRIVTGSEDATAKMFEGPPFVFKTTCTTHDRYVNCVRYAPSGAVVATFGGDAKIRLFDGATGEMKSEFQDDNGHKGSIYAAAWSRDSARVFTASADKTAKLWDITTGKVITTFTVSDAPTAQHMLMGAMWKDNFLLATAFNECIYYFDEKAAPRPTRVLAGHSKTINAAAYSRERGVLTTGGVDGKLVDWDLSNGSSVMYSGDNTNSVGAAAAAGDSKFVGLMDGTVRSVPATETSLGESVITMPSPVLSLTVPSSDVVLVGTKDGLHVVANGAVAAKVDLPAEPHTLCSSKAGDLVAVGLSNGKIALLTGAGTQWAVSDLLERHRSAVSALAFSPDGKWMASGDSARGLYVWDVATKQPAIENWVGFHSSRVTDIAFSPSGTRMASCGSDSTLYVWTVPDNSVRIKNIAAHARGVSSVVFVDDSTLVTTGGDGSVRVWTV